MSASATGRVGVGVNALTSSVECEAEAGFESIIGKNMVKDSAFVPISKSTT